VLAVGTRVKIVTAIGDHPAGAEAVVVSSLGGDVCEIMVAGERLTISCSALVLVDAPGGA
jgi:hypothetical protein